MEHYKLNKDALKNNNFSEKPKRSPLLNVLLILSGINIVAGIYGTFQSLRHGPLTTAQLEEGMSELYTSIGQLRDQNAGESIANMVESVINYSIYVNDYSFYTNAYLLLFSFLVGAISLFFMFSLKKIGFHLYIIYSLLPVLTMYIVAPAYLIPNLNVIFYVIQATILALLYGRNLKYMS